ncbi:response regulator [Agrobacterium vitis]|uniref:response regulator n=1 Tax=Agrobacterium vitis TaxID=373 RepID=UPI0012E856A2|nr:response regulator [Agrobacterium vitis]MVA71028.1 response regulator [Agrobacterium vitis]
MDIMIVEDETLLALELEAEVEAAGHTVVGQAMSRAEAIEIIDREKPDFAFVDVHLLDGPTGIEVGRHLTERGIPYVFVTGNLRRIPPDFVGAVGAIEKPYTMNGLQNALDYIGKRLRGEANVQAPPSLVMAPETQNG